MKIELDKLNKIDRKYKKLAKEAQPKLLFDEIAPITDLGNTFTSKTTNNGNSATNFEFSFSPNTIKITTIDNVSFWEKGAQKIMKFMYADNEDQSSSTLTISFIDSSRHIGSLKFEFVLNQSKHFSRIKIIPLSQLIR